MLQITSKEEFTAEVLNASVPVVVDFWAPWCGPCRSQAPILDSFAAEMGDAVKVVKINTDENADIAGEYGIMSIPTLIVFENGQVKTKAVGVQSMENLKKMCD